MNPSTTSKSATPVLLPNGSSAPSAVKSKMCNKYKTAEACEYGYKCHFAHGEWELGKPISSSQEDFRAIGAIPGHFDARAEPPPVPEPASSFGATATAKISVDASHTVAVIGKGGANSKHSCRQTGVKLSIRGHESHPNLGNIELEDAFEQIHQARTMVRELINSIGAAAIAPRKPFGATGSRHPR